jgi:hypothetical protein
MEEYRMGAVPQPVLAPGARGVSELAELAASVERHRKFWQSEFEWSMKLSGVGPLQREPQSAPSLSVESIAPQVATAFVPVPGDSTRHGTGISLLARRLAPLIADDCATSIDLSAAPGSPSTRLSDAHGFDEFCSALEVQLPRALQRYELECRNLTLSLRADHPGLGRYLKLRYSAGLGRPQLMVRLPDGLLRQARDARDPAIGALWSQITGLSSAGEIVLSLENALRPLNVLCDLETATAAMPMSAFSAAPDSAWLCVRLDVNTGIGCGWLADARVLRRWLTAMLRMCDNLCDLRPWPNQRMREDAGECRRFALHVVGIGDLARRVGMGPARFSTLKSLDPWLEFLKRMLVRISCRMACERGALDAQHIDAVEDAMAATYGAAEARRLRRRLGLRHRHLLALSPYAVFPDGVSHSAYLNLLPLIRHADIINLSAASGLRLAPADERRLLLRTWSIANNRQSSAA